MDDFKLQERLIRIEQLLAANKEVLTLEEACHYTGIYLGYMYKLTSAERSLIQSPWGKRSTSRGKN